MPQEHFDRIRNPRVEKCVAPGQARSANAENAPADQTPPLANGHDEVRDVGTFEITPSEIARIPAYEKVIGRSDTIEEAIELSTDLTNQLQLPSARPSLGTRNRPERIAAEVPHAIRNRLDGIAAEEADRKLAMSGGGEAVVERHLSAAECTVEMLCR